MSISQENKKNDKKYCCEKLITLFLEKFQTNENLKSSENLKTNENLKTKKLKTASKDAPVPTIHTYMELTKYNYSLQQLKVFSKHYNLKISSATKDQLLARIYTFLHLSFSATRIQRSFRKSLERRLISLHGPELSLCTNDTDFITMDELKELNVEQFFSFKDEDGFNYGFDLSSIYNLVVKQEKEGKMNKIVNPYNRNKIPDAVISNLKRTVALSKVLKKKINIELENEELNMPEEKIVELRTLSLFQQIDSLGNYTDYSWFLSLNKPRIIKFVRELSDIFNYRSQLTIETKRSICPPHGDPFRQLSMSYLISTDNIILIKKSVLEIIEKLVLSGVNTDSRALGAYYVLGALTLVNEDAAMSLPWLYQSVSYF
jgi:hypothetical protein